jgi:hypothetical protein
MDRERWAKLTILEQMGNIGAEVGRAISAKRRGDGARMEGAVNRALDLFSATVETLLKDKAQRHRAREVLLSRDEFMSILYDEGRFGEADKIEAYFMNFAMAARKGSVFPGVVAQSARVTYDVV